LESWQPSQHLLENSEKPIKPTGVEMAGRPVGLRTCRMLIDYNQQSGKQTMKIP
jgi:hypothetical protein